MPFDIGGAFTAGANTTSGYLTGQRLRQQDEEARARQAQQDAMLNSLRQSEIDWHRAEATRALRPPTPPEPPGQHVQLQPDGSVVLVDTRTGKVTPTGAHGNVQAPPAPSPYGPEALTSFKQRRDYEVSHPLRDPNAGTENFDPLNPKDQARFIAGEIRKNMAGRYDPLSGQTTYPPVEEATARARSAWEAYKAAVGSQTQAAASVTPQPPFMSTVGTMMGGPGQPPAPQKPFQARLAELQQSGADKETARQTLTNEGYLDPQGRIIGGTGAPQASGP